MDKKYRVGKSFYQRKIGDVECEMIPNAHVTMYIVALLKVMPEALFFSNYKLELMDDILTERVTKRRT